MSENVRLEDEDWKNIAGELVKTLGEAGKGVLFRAGEKAGERVFNRARNVEKIVERFEERGWWDDVDFEGETVKVENSFESRAFSEDNRGCSFIEGVLSTVLTKSRGKPLKVVEVKCSKDECLFEIKKKKFSEMMDDTLEVI